MAALAGRAVECLIAVGLKETQVFMTELNPPTKHSPEIGQWLIETRVKLGLSQEALAAAANVTQPTVSNIETGKSRNPHRSSWEKIITALTSAAQESSGSSEEDQIGEGASSRAEEIKKEAEEVVDHASLDNSIDEIGSLVDFEPHDDDNLPSEPGIYIFYDVTDRPTYIGQSKDIRRRIRGNHDEKFWYREPIVNTAAYIRIENEAQRKQIEKLLITVLRSHALINKAHVQRDAAGDE
jgi:transcriptional regulator with XRE-family HTH domain